MQRTGPPYPHEFLEQIFELIGPDRDPQSLARKFELTARRKPPPAGRARILVKGHRLVRSGIEREYRYPPLSAHRQVVRSA